MSTQWTLVIRLINIGVVALVAFLIRMYRRDTRNPSEEVIAEALHNILNRYFPKGTETT